MSDEKWEKMEDWEIKLEQRIKELEASSASHTEALANGNDGLNKFFSRHQETHQDLKIEIAELKEKTPEPKHIGIWYEETREDKLNNVMYGMYDKRTHVLMKREDLQFLYNFVDWFTLKSYEDEKNYKRIKEEFSL